MSRGVFFMNEFHGEDRIIRVRWTCLFDAIIQRHETALANCGLHCNTYGIRSKVINIPRVGTLADCLGDNTKGQIVWQRGELRVVHVEMALYEPGCSRTSRAE